MSALLHRIARSEFADDLQAIAVGIVLVLVVVAAAFLGAAMDDLAVTVDPSTGQTLVVDTEARR